jgi:hypothetical protein
VLWDPRLLWVLADAIFGSGEEWLGGFDVKQLRDLVALDEVGR